MKTIGPLLIGICLTALLPNTSQADGPIPSSTLIEIGGTTNPSPTSDFGFFVRVEYPGYQASSTTYYGKLKFDMTMDSVGLPPAIELTLIPWVELDRHETTEAHVGTVELSRDIRINQDLNARVTVFGMEVALDTRSPISKDEFSILMRLAGDVVGLKLVNYHNEGLGFAGLAVAEIGAEFMIYSPEVLGITFGLGIEGSADLSLGASHGFALQSDRMAAVTLQAEIFERYALYAKLRNKAMDDTGNGISGSMTELRAGVRVRL